MRSVVSSYASVGIDAVPVAVELIPAPPGSFVVDSAEAALREGVQRAELAIAGSGFRHLARYESACEKLGKLGGPVAHA